jgi:hypothetical protein
MFRNCLLAALLCCTLFTSLYAQPNTVNGYTHQLLFNIYTNQPDNAISGFLRSYAPSLYDKKNIPAANGTANEPVTSNVEIHSFVFGKHPYFATPFTSGKLELYCQHFSDAKGVQVFDVKLWFEFENQLEAEMAFSKLVDVFLPISTNKRFSSTNGAQKAEFSDSKGEKGFNKIQFRLTADNLDRRRFKILFETANDL